ncbi:MAG: acyl-[ACP]--phospholipid O-acyltransferase [Gammaproteobacteria bacterium]|nr:acyl-[ACP]--phospholipid O-acyltransferase [Gammaproteobacteria bacterium]
MSNLFNLLATRRFSPLFIVQFMGAFSDNIFKSALLILITYKFAKALGIEASILNMVAAGIFILPFFLFSAFGGLLADKFSKHILIRYIKAFEFTILLIASYALINEQIWVLLSCLFLTGIQSALFGPAKYGILPELLKEQELLSGNALVEAGTFLSILLGTIVGGLLILGDYGGITISVVLLLCSAIGWFCSFLIPKITSANASLALNANILKQTYDVYALGIKHWEIRRVIFAISWFWFLGYVIQSQLNPLTATVLFADEQVAVMMLVMFTVGIGVGSILCSLIMAGEISARYVPFAGIAMSLFSLDLYFSLANITQKAADNELYTINTFLSDKYNWRILLDMLLLSVAAGFYIVPLYTLLQKRVEDKLRSRTIAANNISNAMFMVVASILVIGVLSIGFGIADLFWMLAVLNFIVAIYIMKIIPKQSLKTLGRILFKLLYRVELKGVKNFPNDSTPYVIVANHTSFLDGPLLMSYMPELPVFAINTDVNKKWWAKIFTQFFEMYPLDPTQPMAVKGLVKMLKNGRKVVIFPEGRITNNGSLMKVYEGPGKIAELGGAKLIPVRIDGAEYTNFGRLKGLVKIKWFPKITISICPPVDIGIPKEVRGSARKLALRRKVYDVMTDMMYRTTNTDESLYYALVKSIDKYGSNHEVLEDVERKSISLGKVLIGSIVLGKALSKYMVKGEHVGMLLPNANATGVTFYALQGLGVVPAMLNFTVGKKSITSALDTAKINTVITSRKFIELGQLEEFENILKEKVKIVYLEDIKREIGVLDKLFGIFKAKTKIGIYKNLSSTKDPAVILFTSGSEGSPKGVMLSHKNLLSNQAQVKSCLDFSSKDRFFNALPVFHSFGLGVGLVLPISSGIKTFLYPSPLHYKIVPELIYDTKSTVVFGTDTFLSGYATHGDPEDFQFTRYVIAGAEKLKTSTREIWMNKFGVRIFEGYGVTETSPALSINNYSYCKFGTVGRMFPGIEVKLDPVPGISEGGRLWVRGNNIMMGYLRAENPGVLEPVVEGWHDTGDIVDIDDEGFISILGRAKRFAKIGGEMVSLTQVEGWLSALWPEQLHCVCAIADERKGEKLVLVTTRENADRKTIQQHITSLGGAEIMVPKEILYIDQIPVLGTGKLDYPSIQKLANEKISIH